MNSPPRRIWFCTGLLAVAVCAGCELFKGGAKETPEQQTLRKLAEAKQSVELELMFIERSIGDPIIDSSLWREVDQIGPLSSIKQRKQFAEWGLRVGVVPSGTPPWAMQTILKTKQQSGVINSNDQSIEKLFVKQLVVPSGKGIQIPFTPPEAETTLKLPQPNQTEMVTQTFKYARGIFRVKAEVLQEGWVRLEVQPEVHHGSESLRHVPATAENGWKFQEGQDVEVIYPLRFELKLNEGEMAILAMTPVKDTPEDAIGRWFFIGKAKAQRVLIVRLVGTGHASNVTVQRH